MCRHADVAVTLSTAVVILLISQQPISTAAAKKSEKCCSELKDQLDFDNIHGTEQVCGDSTWNGHDCQLVATYREAKRICKQAGARLCKLKELRGMETKGTGCGRRMRKAQIWTSSRCEGRTKVITAKANGRKKQCIDKSDEGATAAVQCCADACANQEIVIKVGDGSFADPYYEFMDASGQALDGPLVLQRGQAYRFVRSVSAPNHPFGFQKSPGVPVSFSITDDGEPGITDDGESLSFTLPEDYNEDIQYYCLNPDHTTMVKNIDVL